MKSFYKINQKMSSELECQDREGSISIYSQLPFL